MDRYACCIQYICPFIDYKPIFTLDFLDYTLENDWIMVEFSENDIVLCTAFKKVSLRQINDNPKLQNIITIMSQLERR
jgi:hypothetical protein